MPHSRRPAFTVLAGLLLATLAPAAPASPTPPLLSMPRLTHPGSGQIFYFVLPDRFANGSTANDRGGIAGGRERDGFDPTAISHYHGGDFAGLTAKLDYIKQLGATAVWVTPPFKNKAVQSGTAAYHGYWILDFTRVDPHLGTEAEFRTLVEQAHARGLRVYLDIIVNHTADVISYEGGTTDYREEKTWPYRDADGQPFDERAVAYNGVEPAPAFPRLEVTRSFAYKPVVPPEEAASKHPAWLNDPVYYHNRGNTTFSGENSTEGDFVGLDDLFTANPAVVKGFIEIYRHWIDAYGVDGFRIDTAKHVNAQFWQAFAPAIRAHARARGRPDFLAFGEVSSEPGDPRFLSEFSTGVTLDTTLDFGFFTAARDYVSKGGTAAALAKLFDGDDAYTDHDSNVHSTTTFLGNHDAGRFGYFLKTDNAGATDARLLALLRLGHGLLFLARGQPVVYYGDEQGMSGTGNDMGAREDMFSSQAKTYRELALIGTTRTGADDKFDERHPLFTTIRALATLRRAHPALTRGAMLVRTAAATDADADAGAGADADARAETGAAGLFAFSRIERNEEVEYLAAFNNSRDAAAEATLATSQPAGATWTQIFDSAQLPASGSGLVSGKTAEPSRARADTAGALTVTLAPLQFAVWRADAPLAAPAKAPSLSWRAPAAGSTLAFSSREVDGQVFPTREELRVEVTGGDGLAEVTFALQRASRPEQFELLGTDDAPPYRIAWSPPADLPPGEEFTLIATVDDLRGHRASAQVERVKIAVAAGTTPGIRGAVTPVFKRLPPATVTVARGATLTLAAQVEGSGPLEFAWWRDGVVIPGAHEPTLVVREAGPELAGRFLLTVRAPAGTVVSRETVVSVAP